MNTEFEINGLEFSEILPTKYRWNEAKAMERDGWRLPKKHEIMMLYDVTESGGNYLLWTSEEVGRTVAWAFGTLGLFLCVYPKIVKCDVRLVRGL